MKKRAKKREEKLEEKSQSRKNHNKRSHSFSNRSFVFCLQNFKFWIVVALNNVLLFVVIHSFISWKMLANTFKFFVFTLFFHSFILCVSFSYLKERHLISLQLWCIFQIFQNVSSSLRCVMQIEICDAILKKRSTFYVILMKKNKFFKIMNARYLFNENDDT